VIYVTIRPFSPRTYRRLACHLGEASFLDAVAVLMPNVKLCLTGDSDVPSPIGTSVLVCNHVMDGDWWTILMLGRCIGLRGGVKVFLRNELFGSSQSPNPSTANSPHGSLRKNMNVNMNGTNTNISSINRFGLPSVNSSMMNRRHSPPGLSSSSKRSKSTSSFTVDGHNDGNDTNANGVSSASAASSSSSTPGFRTSTGGGGGSTYVGSADIRHSSTPALHLLAPDCASSHAHAHARAHDHPSSRSSRHHHAPSQPTGPLTQTLVRYLLKTLLEFPCLSAESGPGYVKDRNGLFQLLRDFAQEERSCPVQFLLFPEGWSAPAGNHSSSTVAEEETTTQIQAAADAAGAGAANANANDAHTNQHNLMALRRKLLQAKSNEFAKREGRPQLQHLLLPRTTGFNASLESLRASSPVVYDVTIVSTYCYY
jgi:hypothetical protein